jgi:hypothetical protein
MDCYSIATKTLAFLCEIPKSHDLGHVRSHVIRISKLPKIAKIDSVRPAVPHYSLTFKKSILLISIKYKELYNKTNYLRTNKKRVLSVYIKRPLLSVSNGCPIKE